MVSSVTRLKRKLFPRSMLNSIPCCIATCVLVPGFFIFQMSIMRPKIIDALKMSTEIHYLHLVLATYCFINVMGNMLLSVFTDTTIRGYSGFGEYCIQCRQNQPPRTWHCYACGVCVLTRDHHCSVLSHCIGQHNRRYFICLLLHLTTSLLYAGYYNYFVIASMVDTWGFFLATLRIMHPIVAVEPMGMKELLIVFWYANVFLFFGMGGLLCYHVRNTLRGLTAYESMMKLRGKANWRENIASVFGNRWYWAILWPFVDSPLPLKSQ